MSKRLPSIVSQQDQQFAHESIEWVYPVVDDEVRNSNYLTEKRSELAAKCDKILSFEIDAYLSRVKSLKILPYMLAFLLSLAVAVGVIAAVAVSTAKVHIAIAIILSLVLGYLFILVFGFLVTLFNKLTVLIVKEKLETEDRQFMKAKKDLAQQLQQEMNTIKNAYFEKVVDAQFRFGKDNAGMGILADWCCEQLMTTLKVCDHRQFLNQVSAGMSYQVTSSQVLVTPKVFNDNSNDYAARDFMSRVSIHPPIFYFREHSIYDLDDDVFTLTGCAQALSAHISEKFPAVLEAAGYDPTVDYEVVSNDSQLQLTITVQNPKFVPFQEM